MGALPQLERRRSSSVAIRSVTLASRALAEVCASASHDCLLCFLTIANDAPYIIFNKMGGRCSLSFDGAALESSCPWSVPATQSGE